MAGDVRYQILIDEQADAELTGDLAEIEVSESVRGETSFRIVFAVDICGTDIPLLSDTRLVPGVDRKVSVLATFDGVTSCLVNGIITDRKTQLKEGGPGSSLEISGKDRRIIMGRNSDQRGPLNGTAAMIVQSILGSYDFTPDVEQGDTALYSDETNSFNQTLSDLEIVTKLAGEQGYEFWIDSAVDSGGSSVTDTAHFRTSPPRSQGAPSSFSLPIPLLSPPSAAILKINTGDGTSTMLTFSSARASEVPTASGAVSRVNPDTGDLERTSVTSPSLDPLGQKPPAQTNNRPLLSAGNAQEAQRRQDAALIDASWVITAHAETTAHALGAFIRPHDIVTVQGTGSVDDGSYFVWSVTHHIDPADHKMSCELRRNAVGSS